MGTSVSPCPRTDPALCSPVLGPAPVAPALDACRDGHHRALHSSDVSSASHSSSVVGTLYDRHTHATVKPVCMLVRAAACGVDGKRESGSGEWRVGASGGLTWAAK